MSDQPVARVARLKQPPKVERQPVAPVPGVPESAREIGGLHPLVDFTAKDAQIGDYITGRYLGTRMMALDPQKPEKQTLHFDIAPTCTFEGGEKPAIVTVRSSGVLDQRFGPGSGVKPGQMVMIQYTGQVTTKRNLNPAKDFTVKVWDA